MPAELGGVAGAVHRAIHKAIDATTGDLDRFHFNRAVARIRELTNELARLGDEGEGSAAAWVMRAGLETVARLIGPMTPHIAEELWQVLGHAVLLADTPWPEAQADLLNDDTVTVAVQVNGKLRGTLELARDAGGGGRGGRPGRPQRTAGDGGQAGAPGHRRGQPDRQCGGLGDVCWGPPWRRRPRWRWRSGVAGSARSTAVGATLRAPSSSRR